MQWTRCLYYQQGHLYPDYFTESELTEMINDYAIDLTEFNYLYVEYKFIKVHCEGLEYEPDTVYKYWIFDKARAMMSISKYRSYKIDGFYKIIDHLKFASHLKGFCIIQKCAADGTFIDIMQDDPLSLYLQHINKDKSALKTWSV